VVVGGRGAWGVFNLAQAHLFAEELREFFWADSAQAFESRDLGLEAEFLHRGVALSFTVAIDRFLLVRAGLSDAHAEERRLQHKHVAVVYELFEESGEMLDHQIADVHAVHRALRDGGGSNSRPDARHSHKRPYV
jgi:hypothetical protein